MNYQKFFPSKYLNSADLDGQGDVPVTIRELREEEVQNPEGGTEQKPVLRFEGAEKGLILNRTNADTVAELHGPNVEGWTGKRIVLFIEKDVHAFGKRWDVIRIRNRLPADGNGSVPAGPGDSDMALAVAEEAPVLTEDSLPF